MPWTRRRTVMATVLGTAVLLVGALSTWLVTVFSGLDDITRFELYVDEPSGEYQRPEPSPDQDSVTLLLAGVDNGDRGDLREMLASEQWEPGVFRSDAIMVLHLPGDRSRAELVSIPRDSWVPIDGYGRQKINAAFSYGGPALLTRTVEQVADIRLDHVMVVDWDGFRGITEALGGIQLGDEQLDAEEALTYVRERKSLPRGDFDRVVRQQEFLLGVLKGLHDRNVLTNPVSSSRLVGRLDDLVSVDEGLTSATMTKLAWSARGIGPSDVLTSTAPHSGTATVAGQSIVRLDTPRTQTLFDRIVGTD
ncbi:LCP family protein [Nocardioides coralli]|uniref:LCP family protein n=1 Tax=Nocardioides coralli TaxID=2872154 RepID=UPI001CA39155|nr:LCP family protein [Nocardioides coralli]QZY28793.1 LCP family protein [Nocardioides coralli]